MAPKDKAEKLPVAANLEENLARIDAALARNMAMIKSLRTPSATSQRPTKTKEQLDAEDAEFLQQQSSKLARVGLGLPNAADIKNGLSKRKEFTGNARLRQVLTGKKDPPSTKTQGSAPQGASLKRVVKEDSEDEGEGRSSLGKSKKLKLRPGHVTTQNSSNVEKQSARTRDLAASDRGPSDYGSATVGRALQTEDSSKPDSDLADNTSRSTASIPSTSAEVLGAFLSAPKIDRGIHSSASSTQTPDHISNVQDAIENSSFATPAREPDSAPHQKSQPANSAPSALTYVLSSEATSPQPSLNVSEIPPTVAIPAVLDDPVKLARKREKSRLKKLKLREKQKMKGKEIQS